MSMASVITSGRLPFVGENASPVFPPDSGENE